MSRPMLPIVKLLFVNKVTKGHIGEFSSKNRVVDEKIEKEEAVWKLQQAYILWLFPVLQVF